MSIDLKDAYFHVPIPEDFQKFLAVVQVPLELTCLPFRLLTLPCVFSKVLLAVVALIRTRAIHLHQYLDDLLLLSWDRKQLLEHRAKVILTLIACGCLLN